MYAAPEKRLSMFALVNIFGMFFHAECIVVLRQQVIGQAL